MPVLGFPAGTDWHQPFTFNDEDSAAVNLTGATAMHCIIYRGYNTLLFDLTVGSGITVISATLGQIQVNLTNVQTQSMDGDYLFEIYATLASGDREVLSRGELHIQPTYVGI